jgi:hypothetical protein
MESATFDIFSVTEIVHLIHEHFTNSCPVNVTGLSTWLGFGLVCKLFRSLQVQMLTNESRSNDPDNKTNQPLVRSVHQRAINSHQIVQAVQLFLQYKMYPVTIHTLGCNPIVVDSTRRLKSNSKIEWIVNDSDSTLNHYLPCAPHYSTFFDFVRQKSLEAKKLKQQHFCLFHFRRGYFGLIIQCKVENVSKKSNIKQSLRVVKVYQTQSVRYYGQVQQEANKHPSVYGAALHYLLKDCVQYNTFYISLPTKRKRENDDDESQLERAQKKSRSDDHQFYSWTRNDSNFERYPTTLAVGEREEESEETLPESDYNPPQCRCTFL